MQTVHNHLLTLGCKGRQLQGCPGGGDMASAQRTYPRSDGWQRKSIILSSSEIATVLVTHDQEYSGSNGKIMSTYGLA